MLVVVWCGVVQSDYSVSSITQRYRQIERLRELDNFKDHPFPSLTSPRYQVDNSTFLTLPECKSKNIL